MSYGSTFPIIPYPDLTVGYPHYQHSYYANLDADPYYSRSADNPHSISISQRRLTDERLKCDRNLGWSIDWATAFLVDHLDPENSPSIADTLRQISQRASQLAQDGQCKQLVFQAFNKLNQTIFAGHLKDSVYIGFGRLSPDVSGATYAHGQGPNRRVQRISIILNTHVLRNGDGSHIVSSLIHHMVHAYFLVACGPEDEKQTGYGRLEHSEPFLKIIRTIKELARSRETLWIPGLIGRRQPNLRYDSYEDYHRPPPVSKPQRKQWYCSHCPHLKSATPTADVDKWYDGVCKPLLDLPEINRKATVLMYNKRNELEEVRRAEAPSSSASMEIFFRDEKPVLVPADKFGAFPSICAAFDKLGCRYLELSENVSKDGFRLLLELLHTGTYSPDVTHAVSGAAALGSASSGPPIIKPVRPHSPPYLMASITVFKMGVELGFDDLLGLALGRMRAQPVTHEDAVDVLSAIYSGGGKDPHPDMRTWVRDFLLVAPVVKSDQWGLGRGLASAAQQEMEVPNLFKLRGEMCYKERFAALLEGCGALHIDVLKVEEGIALLTGRRGVGIGVGERRLLGNNVNVHVNGVAGYAHGGPAGVGVPIVPIGLGRGVPIGVGIGVGTGHGLGMWRDRDEMDEYARYMEEIEAERARLGWMGERFEDRWGY